MSASIHVCPTCGSGFHRPSALKVHLNTHTGAKPFLCPWKGCEKTYSVNSNMRRHLRTHTDQEFPPDDQEKQPTVTRPAPVPRDDPPPPTYNNYYTAPAPQYLPAPYAVPVYPPPAPYYHPQSYPQEYAVPRTFSRTSSATSSSSSTSSDTIEAQQRPASREGPDYSNPSLKRRREEYSQNYYPSQSYDSSYDAYAWSYSMPIPRAEVAHHSQSPAPVAYYSSYSVPEDGYSAQNHHSRSLETLSLPYEPPSPFSTTAPGVRTVYSVRSTPPDPKGVYNGAITSLLSREDSDEEVDEDYEYEKRVLRMAGELRGQKRQRV